MVVNKICYTLTFLFIGFLLSCIGVVTVYGGIVLMSITGHTTGFMRELAAMTGTFLLVGGIMLIIVPPIETNTATFWFFERLYQRRSKSMPLWCMLAAHCLRPFMPSRFFKNDD